MVAGGGGRLSHEARRRLPPASFVCHCLSRSLHLDIARYAGDLTPPIPLPILHLPVTLATEQRNLVMQHSSTSERTLKT